MRRRLAVVVLAHTVALVAASSAQAGDYIVVLKDGVNEPTAAADQAKRGANVRQHFRNALNAYAAQMSDQTVASVKADPKVAFVTANRRFRIPRDQHRFRPSDEIAPRNCEQIISFDAFRVGAAFSSAIAGDCRGAVNANVAIVDTGIDRAHPDLNVAGGKNCSGDPGAVGDDDGHGTFVAGILGARDDANGIVGVAPGVNLFAVRVFDRQGNGSTETVLCGLDWITATRLDTDKHNDIDVANMSLGDVGADDGHCGRRDGDPIHLAVCRMSAAGVPLVASAGNEGADEKDHVPAAYDEVVTATAIANYDDYPGALADVSSNSCGETIPDDHFADFSNWATLPADRAHTVAAPGVCVPTTFPLAACGVTPPESCYSYVSGTSFSAPMIAGTIALCIAYRECTKGWSAQQIKAKILRDAALYNLTHPAYGFKGDPFRPVPGRYYGWLIRAGIY